MKPTRKSDTQDKKKFQQIEKAIKESYSEVRKTLKAEEKSCTYPKKQKHSAPCFQYYF